MVNVNPVSPTDDAVVRGRYRLLTRLGQGGMAEVYRGKLLGAEGFEKFVAIKRVLPHRAQDPELVRSFIDEARLAAHLHHPNIVQIYDFGRHGDTYFIAMEYLSGQQLGEVAARARETGVGLPRPLIYHALARVCEALDYAHHLTDYAGQPLNIIHRDVSPQNIVVTYAGQIKLIDFGIAKAATQTMATEVGTLKGKTGYLSPEQARGDALDARSDLFAVGVILYELLLGERPIAGDVFRTLEQLRGFDPSQLAPQLDTLERGPREVLTTALAPDPADRYARAEDLQAALERLLVSGETGTVSARDWQGHMSSHWAAERDREARILQHEASPESEPSPVSPVGGTARIPGEPPPSASSAVPEPSPEPPRSATAGAPSRSPGDWARRLGWVMAGLIALVLVGGLLTRPLIDQPPSLADTSETAEPSLDATDTAGPRDAGDEPSPPAGSEAGPAIPVDRPAPERRRADQRRWSRLEDRLAEGDLRGAAERFFDWHEALPGLDPQTRRLRTTRFAMLTYERLRDRIREDAKAAETLLQALRGFAPDTVEWRFLEALARLRQDRPEAARSGFKAVLAVAPRHVSAHFNLAYLAQRTGESADARRHYRRVVALGPDFQDEALYNLAVLEAQAGAHESARQHLRQALRFNPENRAVKRYLRRFEASPHDNTTEVP